MIRMLIIGYCYGLRSERRLTVAAFWTADRIAPLRGRMCAARQNDHAELLCDPGYLTAPELQLLACIAQA
jgi:hypothetical protein